MMLVYPFTLILIPYFIIPLVSGSLFKQCALMMPSYTHQTCVTYEDLNAAFDHASSKFGIPHVGEKFTVMNVGTYITFWGPTSFSVSGWSSRASYNRDIPKFG